MPSDWRWRRGEPGGAVAVRERGPKSDYGVLLRFGQLEVAKFVVVHGGGIFRRGPGRDIARVVEMDELFERLEIAIVAVRRRDGDVAKRGHLEFPVFLGRAEPAAEAEVDEAGIGGVG